MPQLGDVSGTSQCDRLKTMRTGETARLERPGCRKATHDRRPVADVGYKVWNPFEAELRTDSGVRRDGVAKAFTRTLELIER
jgi:hypothetical protein